MSDRQKLSGFSAAPDLILHYPRNWTAAVFLGSLGAIHLFVAVSAFEARRWEGRLSLAAALGFATLALVCLLVRRQLAVSVQSRLVRVRIGIGAVFCSKWVRFHDIQAVRVVLGDRAVGRESAVTIVCRDTDIACPPTSVPRHVALCLAMTIDVRLVKVYVSSPGSAVRQRLDGLFKSDEVQGN